MAIPGNIITAIDNFFTAYTSIANYNTINSDGNKYELYIYSLVHNGLQGTFALTPQNLDGAIFKFKCSPGPINFDYSNFEFHSATKGRLELRNGIEYTGHKLEHEIDVSVQDAAHGGNHTRPINTSLLLGVECKFYSNSNSLKGEARKNLGAITDLTHHSHPLRHLRGAAIGCLHCGIGFNVAFVTNRPTTERTDIQNFLNDYGLNSRFGILPGTVEERNFVQFITVTSAAW